MSRWLAAYCLKHYSHLVTMPVPSFLPYYQSSSSTLLMNSDVGGGGPLFAGSQPTSSAFLASQQATRTSPSTSILKPVQHHSTSLSHMFSATGPPVSHLFPQQSGVPFREATISRKESDDTGSLTSQEVLEAFKDVPEQLAWVSGKWMDVSLLFNCIEYTNS